MAAATTGIIIIVIAIFVGDSEHKMLMNRIDERHKQTEKYLDEMWCEDIARWEKDSSITDATMKYYGNAHEITDSITVGELKEIHNCNCNKIK